MCTHTSSTPEFIQPCTLDFDQHWYPSHEPVVLLATTKYKQKADQEQGGSSYAARATSIYRKQKKGLSKPSTSIVGRPGLMSYQYNYNHFEPCYSNYGYPWMPVAAPGLGCQQDRPSPLHTAADGGNEPSCIV